MSAVIRVDSLNKTFARKQALFNLKLEIQAGEMVALIGASGSGKSTLLRHVAGLARCDRDNGGSIDVLGRRLQASGRLSGEVRRLRADIGYIFQQFNLVNRLSVLDNVLLGFLGRMPRWRGSLGLFSAEQKRQALEALARVGLADFAGQRASTLSGGQQQRVAIARALTQKAEVILAERGVTVLPDILANAGGVTVSYFEWVQDRIAYFWGQEEVDSKMENIMVGAFHDVAKMAEAFEVSYRIAAYMLAIDRVSRMTKVRGVYA